MAQSVRIVLVRNATAFSGDDRRRSSMLRLTEPLYIHCREYTEYIQYIAEQSEYNKFFALARSAATKIFALSFRIANNMRAVIWRKLKNVEKKHKNKTSCTVNW